MNKLIKLHNDTQAAIDKDIAEFINLWDEEFKKSGLSDELFKKTDAAIFITSMYKQIKDEAESEGFTIPEFDSKTKRTFH